MHRIEGLEGKNHTELVVEKPTEAAKNTTRSDFKMAFGIPSVIVLFTNITSSHIKNSEN